MWLWLKHAIHVVPDRVRDTRNDSFPSVASKGKVDVAVVDKARLKETEDELGEISHACRARHGSRRTHALQDHVSLSG